MSLADVTLQSVCTKNRAEELGHDVWQHFVIPLFFDQLDVQTATKPWVIIGGRGCGKTMLLRYLSHQSTFSPQRPSVPEEAIYHLGLYWKVDTHFLSMMTKRGIPDDVWDVSFNHFLALVVSQEILACLASIAQSKSSAIEPPDLARLDFSSLADFHADTTGNVEQLLAVFRKLERNFQAWVNNPRKVPEPVFLPGKGFLWAILEEVRRQLPALRASRFFVYIDEYENLREYQQRHINTHLKHSEPPLIFSIAAKRNGIKTRETVGDESISDISDYRTHDLDEYARQYNFELYAAEILFLRFATMANVHPLPVDVDGLRDPARLGCRRAAEYARTVISAAQRIFPGLSQRELAESVLQEPVLRRKLEEDTATALKRRRSTIAVSNFIRTSLPEASVVVPALLHRRKPKDEELVDELNRLESGLPNRFTGSTNWVHNNFVGCLLQLYAPYNRACPFYAGFDTFIGLAGVNLRHFLELCHKSLKHAPPPPGFELLSIDPVEQAEAARQASTEFLREIRTFGRLGNRLHAFVLTLGSLFAIAHRRPTQSEPEINHFSVQGGPGVLGEEDEEFFREAIKWSVLSEEAETKTKDPLQVSGKEWILAPIYAPYFHISYRKRRRIELRVDEVRVMIRGDNEARRDLLRQFMKKLSIESADVQRDLFAHLEDS